MAIKAILLDIDGTLTNSRKEITPDTYKKLMKPALVYDGRNIHSLQSMKDAGVEYYSIGR